MNLEQIRQALQKLDPAEYGIYTAEIQYFFQHLDDMEKVRSLGGLHVIGSERHEARRIDNQLRGRSARQGDPGSSRFYLSLEDELMRLFGGAQADGLMQRLKIDDAMPLEVGLVGRLVEQSQTRVEGSNFEVRKHLLEYDDVLNTQRAKIYGQRNRIFSKEDLSDDIDEMLRTEVNRRVPEALNDEGGPWKLLAWLDQIQPSFRVNQKIAPSYSVKLLADYILQGQTQVDRKTALAGLIEITSASIDAEREHMLQQVNTLLNQSQDKLETQLEEQREAVDTYFEGLALEEQEQPRRPTDILNELSNLIHLPVKLSAEAQRTLLSQPDQAKKEIFPQGQSALIGQTINRLIGAIERRLEESLELNPAQLAAGDWNQIADQILEAVEAFYANRKKRYLGGEADGEGQIQRELQNSLEKLPELIDENTLLASLLMIPQGAKAVFDKKTHRRVWQRTSRVIFIYSAAHFLENRSTEEVASEVLEHLEEMQQRMYQAWGQTEWNRLAETPVRALSETVQRRLVEAIGKERLGQLQSLIDGLEPEEQEAAIEALGRMSLTEIYRQLLLSVVTELWVDYLTQMEALRISIGLEAYAQRDPLVQYKNRAFALFQELLSNMRLAVVSRMFTYRPREGSTFLAANAGDSVQADSNPARSAEETQEEEYSEDETVSVEAVSAGETGAGQTSRGPSASSAQGNGGKRKRHRRR
jgi:preprotein translocase subunit SecA